MSDERLTDDQLQSMSERLSFDGVEGLYCGEVASLIAEVRRLRERETTPSTDLESIRASVEVVRLQGLLRDIIKPAGRLLMHIGVTEIDGRQHLIAHAIGGLPETLEELRRAVERAQGR